MKLLDYAPVEFKEYLETLDNTIKFSKVRLHCELESDSDNKPCSTLQHYVMTGNEGVGIPDAIREIRQRLFTRLLNMLIMMPLLCMTSMRALPVLCLMPAKTTW